MERTGQRRGLKPQRRKRAICALASSISGSIFANKSLTASQSLGPRSATVWQ